MRNGAKKLRIWPRETWQKLSQARLPLLAGTSHGLEIIREACGIVTELS